MAPIALRLALAGAALLAGAAPALARHQPPAPPPVAQPVPVQPTWVPYGPPPYACAAPGEPDRHGWPPACAGAGAPYPGQAWPVPGPAGQIPVYTGAWTAPPGYYVAGVMMVPVPVGPQTACQPCGESRTETTTRVIDVPSHARGWRPVPPRHRPVPDKRVKERPVKEKRVKE